MPAAAWASFFFSGGLGDVCPGGGAGGAGSVGTVTNGADPGGGGIRAAGQRVPGVAAAAGVKEQEKNERAQQAAMEPNVTWAPYAHPLRRSPDVRTNGPKLQSD